MNAIESFDFSVPAGNTRQIEIAPQRVDDIIGVMTSDSEKGVKISLRTANSNQLIDRVESIHVQDRSVEWGKNYIPVNIRSQKMFLQVENNSASTFASSLVIIYSTENPTSEC